MEKEVAGAAFMEEMKQEMGKEMGADGEARDEEGDGSRWRKQEMAADT